MLSLKGKRKVIQKKKDRICLNGKYLIGKDSQIVQMGNDQIGCTVGFKDNLQFWKMQAKGEKVV